MAEATTTATQPPWTPEELRTRLADRWGTFVALGVALVVLGTIGLFMVGTLTLVTVLWFAALLIAGGAMHLWHAFQERGWRSFLAEAAIGLLYVVAGALILANPLLGSKTLTLMLGIVILVVGVARVVMAFQHRQQPGWVWLLLGGLITVALGLMILAAIPEGALWILGLFVAIELLTEGWGMVIMGLALRRWKRHAQAPA